MVATTPASRKAKGRRFQQAVRQDLLDLLASISLSQTDSSPDHRWQNLAEGLMGGEQP